MVVRRNRALSLACGLVTPIFASYAFAAGPQVQVLLPLGRVAYQTNEKIDLSVVRSSGRRDRGFGPVVTLNGEDGSKLALVFRRRR